MKLELNQIDYDFISLEHLSGRSIQSEVSSSSPNQEKVQVHLVKRELKFI